MPADLASRLLARPKSLYLAAALVYLVLTGALALPHTGLQYDEALMVLGGVQMLRSPAELPLPHDPDTWIKLFGRHWPLMTVRYVGAVKDWLSLPLFAVFGTEPWVVRLLSMLLASVGVYGAGRLTGWFAGPAAGAVAALVLAVNPSFSDQTVFDNGAIAAWAAAGGWLSVAAVRYLERPGWGRAFWTGCAAGFGLWARANFLWVVIGLGVGFSPQLIIWVRHRYVDAGIGVLGSVVGALPLVVYQVVSKGGTFQAVQMFEHAESPWQLLPVRLVNWAESLLTDREHRAIWAGPECPDWQIWFVGVALAAGLATCLSRNKARGLAIALAVFYGLTFSSRLPVAEHHFVPVLPLAACVITIGAFSIRGTKPVWAVAGLVYLGLAGWWQVSQIEGVARTGGDGQWSDAIAAVQEHLETKPKRGEVKIIDWGLQNNLFVMSAGRLKTREILEEAVDWKAIAGDGGLFLANGPANRIYPAPYQKFTEAMRDNGQRPKRTVFRQANGTVYAELLELEPQKAVR